MQNLENRACRSGTFRSCMCILTMIFLLAVTTTEIEAQQLQTITGAKGSASISGDISPNQARVTALNEAKLSALKSAGVSEYLNTYQVLFSSQKKNDFTQFFSSDLQTEMQGAVQDYKVTDEKLYCKGDKEIVYEITINAAVIKYNTKPDPEFDASIEGVKGVYNNDQDLSFEIKTTQDCYLTIFNITDAGALLLYPNSYEQSSKVVAQQITKYPTVKIDYLLHTDQTNGETNRLIFVFTKTKIPFIKMNREQSTTQENIFSWIYSIMPDQRKVQYVSFVIQK